MIHQLKLHKSFFEEKIQGLKPWELRLNDRGFKVGDYIGENEVIDKDGEWVDTGRFVIEKIVNIVTSDECPGVQKGWVILTTAPCFITDAEDVDLHLIAPDAYGGSNDVE
jgi:ParB family chromosome partitioning protein